MHLKINFVGTVNKIFKISLLILTIFLYQNIFAEEDAEIDEIKKFTKNFYSEVYNNLDTEKKTSFRLSKESWLSQWAIESIINSEDKYFDEITNYCNEKFNWRRWECEKSITDKFLYEEDILKIEKWFNKETFANEIWSDWNMQNSFFDVIYDLNIIDIILFWEDATIFFYKYDSSSSEPLYSLWKWNTNQNSGNVELIKNYIEWTDEFWKPTTTWNKIIWNSWTLINGDNSDTKKYWTNLEVKNYYSWNSDMCTDPLRFAFEDNTKNSTWWNQIINWTTWSSLIESPDFDNLGISEELFSNITNLDNEDFKILKIWNDWYLEFKDENKKKDIECKKKLYWWLICLDKLKNTWLCTEDKMFCIEIIYKITTQDLLWWYSWWWKNSWWCIACLVRKMIMIIEDNLMWRTLTPRENSNKNGNLPNWMSVFRNPSKLFNVTYVPLPWLKEKDPNIIDKMRIEKERENEKTLYSEITNCEDRSFITPWQEANKVSDNHNDCATILDNGKNFLWKYQKEISRIDSRKMYFSDVYLRFKEFRTLFENWIEYNINKMPLNDWEKIKSCNEIKK